MLLGIGVIINFFDRVNLSVAVTPMRGEFGLSNIAIGYLLSTYSWTYVMLQLPSGPVLDRFGCLLYTSPSPRDYAASRMPSSA